MNHLIPIGQLVSSNKHTGVHRFYACISSRITTVIQLVRDHQINYNCFNEPSAVSTIQHILRLAWLNLWDKHMTTGRINQVSPVMWSSSGRGEPRRRRQHTPSKRQSLSINTLRLRPSKCLRFRSSCRCWIPRVGTLGSMTLWQPMTQGWAGLATQQQLQSVLQRELPRGYSKCRSSRDGD